MSMADYRNELINNMAREIKAWIAANPGKDPETDPDLDARCERTAPGFSGGMFSSALRKAQAPSE